MEYTIETEQDLMNCYDYLREGVAETGTQDDHDTHMETLAKLVDECWASMELLAHNGSTVATRWLNEYRI